MVLSKDELINALANEIRVLLHLASKVDPAQLDYRPTAKQRSTIELLQYLTIMGPIHMRAMLGPRFDGEAWNAAWSSGEAAAKAMGLEETKQAIAGHSALLAELVGSCSDDDLRAEIEMFGGRASRGQWMLQLVLSHYTAYRMQLFLYLKASGREELNTLNLWGGVDSFPAGASAGDS